MAWKEAEVVPILRKGDHDVASNNRPLSLLPVAAKVCEKIVLEQFFQISHYKQDFPHNSAEIRNPIPRRH